MVRGREAKLVKLAAASAPYAFLDLPWEEALQAFVERVPQNKNELQRLLKAYAQRSDEARRLALEQIQKFVKGSLERHIAEGGTYGDFADDLEAGKESLGITTADPAYLKMVFRTNVQSAYGAGRFRAITDPDVIELRPYVQYRTVGDARVRPEHAVLDRGIYLAASPEWHRIAPPNSFNCRCSMCSLSRDEVVGEKVLGQVPANYVSATPEFDTAPMPHLEPANDNAREMSVATRQKPTQLELSYDPSQARAEDGKWSSGSAAGRTGALTPHKEAYNAAKAAHGAAPSEKSRAALQKAADDLRRARRVVGEHNHRGEDIADDAHAHGKVIKAQAKLADANERFAAARKSGDKVAAAEAGGDIDWAKHEHAQARSDLLNHYVETGRADKALEVAHKPVADLTDDQIGAELKRIHAGTDGDDDAAVKKSVVRGFMDDLAGNEGYDENHAPISERAHFGVLDQYKEDVKSIGVKRAKLEKTPAAAARKEAKAKYDEAAKRMKARAERLVDELGLKAHVADNDDQGDGSVG